MPGLLARSETSLVLSAFDAGGNLSAFFVIETGARRFTVYVVGCYSQDPYVAHASDLLFREMIRLSREQSKEAIHLGLGVNEGIRRFKKKWGGVPDLPYFAGRIATREKTALSWLAALGARP
jgi:hypothetical protein